MNKPNWKNAPEWANWLAMDGNGEWFWYQYKPIKPLLDEPDAQWTTDKGKWCSAERWDVIRTLEKRPND